MTAGSTTGHQKLCVSAGANRSNGSVAMTPVAPAPSQSMILIFRRTAASLPGALLWLALISPCYGRNHEREHKRRGEHSREARGMAFWPKRCKRRASSECSLDRVDACGDERDRDDTS